jgi:hypothetical protein
MEHSKQILEDRNEEGLNEAEEMDVDYFVNQLFAQHSPTRDGHEGGEGPLTSADGQMDKGKNVLSGRTAENIGNPQYFTQIQEHAG